MGWHATKKLYRIDRAGRIRDAKQRQFSPWDVPKRWMHDCFPCVCCGTIFTPADGQWIFYDLCDLCAGPFYDQRDRGRYGGVTLGARLHGGPSGVPHFDDSRKWAAANSPCKCAHFRSDPAAIEPKIGMMSADEILKICRETTG